MLKLTKTRLSLLAIAAVTFFSVVVISCNSAETPAEEKKDTTATQPAATTVSPDTTAKSATTDTTGTDTTGKGGQQTPPAPK